MATANAERLELDVELLESDLLAAVAGRRFHLVVSNPPYVAESELAALEPEVAAFEPRTALVAGPEGTEVLDRLVAEAPAALGRGGWLAVECGAGQAAAVAARIASAGGEAAFVDRDLAGVERVVGARFG